ncbi:hypothetical protein Tco_0328824 [Tanacetum coccineum]
MTDEKTFQCISLNDEHTCVRNFNFGALVNYKWIAKIFGDKIRANPDIRLCDIADLVMKKYKCKVSLNQCTNAKKYALTEYEKSIDEHYSLLRSYGKAILDSNPGSTVKLGVAVNSDGKTYFDRFWHVIPAGGNLYEVRSRSEGFAVDEGKRTFSCSISGLPCVHATKVGLYVEEWWVAGVVGQGVEVLAGSSEVLWVNRKTQVAPQQTQHELEQTQVEDQVE